MRSACECLPERGRRGRLVSDFSPEEAVDDAPSPCDWALSPGEECPLPRECLFRRCRCPEGASAASAEGVSGGADSERAASEAEPSEEASASRFAEEETDSGSDGDTEKPSESGPSPPVPQIHEAQRFRHTGELSPNSSGEHPPKQQTKQPNSTSQKRAAARGEPALDCQAETHNPPPPCAASPQHDMAPGRHLHRRTDERSPFHGMSQ